MAKITPFLWFNGQAGEATKLYSKVFPDSKIISSSTGADGKINGSTMELNGTEFILFNGDPSVKFEFNETISFFIKCKDQDEVDKYWTAFIENGGTEGQCGWLKDKFGVSWQIVPNALGECLGNPDREKANKAMQAMLKMKKLIVAELQNAMEAD